MSLTPEQQLKLEEALIIQKNYLLGLVGIMETTNDPRKNIVCHTIATVLQAVAPVWIAVGYEYKLNEIADKLPPEYRAQLRFLDSGFKRSGF